MSEVLSNVQALPGPNYPPIIYPAINLKQNTPGFEYSNATSETYENRMDEDKDDEDDEDDDDDDEEDEDQEDSSEISDGDNLLDDIESALSGDFEFKGTFAHSQTFPTTQAPNPCLFIAGLGTIGLPLSERDAKLIVGCSKQAPFGKGQHTVVDTKVRDTWEIEPSKLVFANPEWDPFVQNQAVASVCKALGVAPSVIPPRCELYKLLLYEQGSHFLPHQDTQKTNGMFATMIIILPSLYTGGEVHVSHGSEQKVFDLAPSSMLSTSVLAWYTDVLHEVKSVTSGYRLALSYNLIHVSYGVPRPMLPEKNDADDDLRHILNKWRKEKYDVLPEQNIVAYLLNHKYSVANLRSGLDALKGEDAHKVAHLRISAEEFGIMICLANLEYHVTGSADDDCGYNGWKRSRYYGESSDEEEETPGMGDIDDTDISINNLVDLDGNSLLGSASLSLDSSNLIPENPFEDGTPDRASYEGYMGNYPGQVEHWYHSTVLILVPEDEAHGLFLATGGKDYALQRLRLVNSAVPTNEDRKLVNSILTSAGYDKTTAQTIMEYALKWDDAQMWRRVINYGGSLLSNFDMNQLVKAWQQFSFGNVRPSFEALCQKSPRLQDRLEFINLLPAYACPEELEYVRRWCQQQVTIALESYDAGLHTDVPIIITVAVSLGFFAIRDLMNRLSKKTSTYAFLTSFIRSFHENKERLLQSQRTVAQASSVAMADSTQTSSVEEEYFKIVDLCLDVAVRQWDTVVATPRSYYAPPTTITPTQQDKVNRIVELMELCLLTARMSPCEKLFVLLLKSPTGGSMAKKFQNLWSPLIPPLQVQLIKSKVEIYSSPFVDLIRLIISSYLHDVLGSKPRSADPRMRKIGCGCNDCTNMIESFMTSGQTTLTHHIVKARRLHIENRLRTAPDLVSFVTVTSRTPHGVAMTKRPNVVAVQSWKSRQVGAKAFLATIGNDQVLKKIMGNRFEDIHKALTGTQQFAMTATISTTFHQTPTAVPGTRHQVPPAAIVQGNAQTSSGVAESGGFDFAPDSTLSTSAPHMGQKRKQAPVVLGPIIDLTGEDSS